MSDYRIVQCFGVKRVPKKPDTDCRKKYLWTAGGLSGNFGRKGTQACPNCGNLPDFMHPYNRYLDNEISLDQAESAMPEYIKNKNK